MNVEVIQRSWGEHVIVTMKRDRVVEIMRFDEEGSDHTHHVTEIATCISGRGWLWRDGVRREVAAPIQCEISAGVQHHMEPDPDSHDHFEWIIRYDA